MLKVQVGSEPLDHPPRAPSSLVSADDEDRDHSPDFLDDGDLCLFVPDTSLLSIVAALCPSGSAGPPSVTLAGTQPLPDIPLEQGSSCSSLSPRAPLEQPSSSQMALRHTERCTAGQHSNVHHLPQPVGPRDGGTGGPSRPVSNAQSPLFRPWC